MPRIRRAVPGPAWRLMSAIRDPRELCGGCPTVALELRLGNRPVVARLAVHDTTGSFVTVTIPRLTTTERRH